MKFVKTDNYTFWWPVIVRQPDPDNAGKIIEQDFEIQFVAIGNKKAKQMDKEKAALDSVDDLLEHDIKMFKSVSTGWRGVRDENGREVSFSDKSFDDLLQYSWVRIAMAVAYQQAMAGEEARVKN